MAHGVGLQYTYNCCDERFPITRLYRLKQNKFTNKHNYTLKCSIGLQPRNKGELYLCLGFSGRLSFGCHGALHLHW